MQWPGTSATFEKIKAKIELKNRLYMEYMKNGRNIFVYLSQNVKGEISPYVSKCKKDYFVHLGERLGDSLMKYFYYPF